MATFISTNLILQTLNLTQATPTFANSITQITLGNGQGEFSLDPNPVLLESTENDPVEIYLNINTQQYITQNTDITIALQELTATFPSLKKITVEIAWYVTDLNCTNTLVQPGVVAATLSTLPYEWQVANVFRNEAHLLSSVNGIPSYRGTPSDQALINLLQVLSSMEYDIAICLTLLCDIPAGNTLNNPYSNNAATIGEPTYPQAKYLTITPAKGYNGSPFGTANADTQILNFFGTEDANSYTCTFNSAGSLTTVYNNETQTFNYSNFVVYYATMLSALKQKFPGINLTDFFIGKNLVGLTTVQGASGGYSAVTSLTALAQECSGLFSGLGVNVSYVANWDEWQGTQNEDTVNLTTPATRIFNMDTLWSSSAISYIAICANYPTTDWRNVGANFDGLFYPSYTNQPYIVEGLLGQQYYDWFYASESNSQNQIRTTIVGPTENTTWIYQLKNYDSWIANYHYNYNGSSFSSTPTNWVPNSKKLYLYGIECPSVNVATNQPDAYLHQASSVYELPYYSNGTAANNVMGNWFPIYETYLPYASPNENITAWSAYYWDDRPYPWYPLLTTQWLDCADYTLDSCINNKVVTIDPTQSYTQTINYSLLLTNQFANNPYWVTLNQAMDIQWNNLFNTAIVELQNIRNVDAIEDELIAANVRQMGFVVPNYGLQYSQYENLLKYLGTYYLTRGNSVQFLNFVSFFSQIAFSFIPLFAENLDYNTLTSAPGTLITQAASGTWIPTPYYDISYDPSVFPDLNEDLYRQLLVQSAPIYLVLRNFIGQVNFPSVPIYLSSAIIDYEIQTLALASPLFPPTGQVLLTISVPASATPGGNLTVTGTTMEASASVNVSLYKTNNSALILSGRVTFIEELVAFSENNAYSLTFTCPTGYSTLYAVVTDTTETIRNGITSLNEIAISSAITV